MRVHELPGPAANHHQWRFAAFGHVLANHFIVPRLALQMGQQRAAIQVQTRVCGSSGHLHQRGQQIDGGHAVCHPVRSKVLWRMDDQGHACRHFKPMHLVPKAALAQHVAVVARKHDDGVVSQAAVVQRFDQCADLAVHIAAGAKVGAPGTGNGFVGQGLVPQIDHLEQALGVRILVGLGNHGARHGNVNALIQVPVLCRYGVRVVRVRHGHRQAKRLLGVVSHMVVQVLAGFEHHLFVKVELVASHAGAGLQHRGPVVVPARAHFQLVPVHRPAVVGGVNVAGQALLVAMQLVGAAKVHLAGQRRAVAQVAQVVRIGRHVGRQVRRVVKTANARGQLPAHQAKARRRAQRAVAVRRIKGDALRRQCGQVRHLHHGRRVMQGQQGSGHLVGHDEQDVGAFGSSGCHSECAVKE